MIETIQDKPNIKQYTIFIIKLVKLGRMPNNIKNVKIKIWRIT